jgi:hypothetical protein
MEREPNGTTIIMPLSTKGKSRRTGFLNFLLNTWNLNGEEVMPGFELPLEKMLRKT